MPSSHHRPNWLGKPAHEIDAHFNQLAGQKLMVAKCAFCDWEAWGKAHDVITAAKAHREQEHPHARWTQARKRRTLKRPTLRTDLRPEDHSAIEVERLRRARLHGITEELV